MEHGTCFERVIMSIAKSASRLCVIIALLMASAAPAASAASPVASKAYRFDLIGQPRFTAGNEVVDVRLVRQSDGKPVPDGFILTVSATMAPGGMPGMTAPILPMNGTEPGRFTFTLETQMHGRWLIAIVAKRNSGRETINGNVVIDVRDSSSP